MSLETLTPLAVKLMKRDSRLLYVVARAQEWVQKYGKDIDAGTMVLALWLADPGGGEMVTNIQCKRGDDGHMISPCIAGFSYKPSATGIRHNFWDIEGCDDQGVIKTKRAALLEQGCDLALEIYVDVHNLDVLLKEFSLPKADVMLALELAGEFFNKDAEKLSAIQYLGSPKGEIPDLWKDPFGDDEYIAVMVGCHCSPLLRDLATKTVDEYRIRLMKAAINTNRIDWMREILDRGYDLGEREYFNGGGTALHLAENNPEATKLLIERGSDVHARDGDGRTPLHSGANGEVAKILLAHGARVDAEDKKCFTPLHFALKLSAATPVGWDVDRFQVINSLLAAGADPFCSPDEPDDDYLTPFQFAVKEGYADHVEFLARRFEVDWAQRTEGERTLIQLAGKNQQMKGLLRAIRTDLAIRESMDSEEGGVPAPQVTSRAISIL